MKHTFFKLSFAALSVMAAGSALADSQREHFADGVYIAPGINVMDVHNIWDGDHTVVLKRKVGANFGVGYQFDNPWAVELLYQYAKPDMATADQKIRVDYTHLDGLYTFDTLGQTALAPYVVAGIGAMKYKTSNFNKTDTTLNAGAGLKYAFNPNIQLRFDARYTLGLTHADSGASVNLGLLFAFGSTQQKTEQVVQTLAPAPVVAEPIKEVVAVMDADGDGIADEFDQCPDTKAGAKVDEQGCYVYLTETREFTLNVTFALASADIDSSAQGDIEALAVFLKEYPNTKVTIEGHSDNTGSAWFNKQLSQQRAEAVKQSLIDNYAVDADRLSAIGYGMQKPIADNATEEGRAQNRRVVAKVEAQEQVIQQADAE